MRSSARHILSLDLCGRRRLSDSGRVLQLCARSCALLSPGAPGLGRLRYKSPACKRAERTDNETLLFVRPEVCSFNTFHHGLQVYLGDQVQAVSQTADETIDKARQRYHEYYKKER